MTAVMRYFGLSASEFKPLWLKLSEESKKQLIAGVKDRTFTY